MIIIMIVLFLAVGLFSIISCVSSTKDDINNLWNVLSPFSKLDYYENNINYLYYVYYWKSIITGILYVSISASGIILILLSVNLIYYIDGTWRPPLRSKINDETAKKFIDFYNKHAVKEDIKQKIESKEIQNNNIINDNNQLIIKERPVTPVKENINPIENEKKTLLNKDNQTIEQDKYGSNVPLNYDYYDNNNSINQEIPNEREEIKENVNKPKRIFKRIKKENN